MTPAPPVSSDPAVQWIYSASLTLLLIGVSGLLAYAGWQLKIAANTLRSLGRRVRWLERFATAVQNQHKTHHGADLLVPDTPDGDD
jgi:hypothetical protein